MTPTISFTGECLDLEVRKGVTMSFDLELEDDNGTLLDLTGYTFPAAIRDKTGAVLYTFPPATVVSPTKHNITISASITDSSAFVVGLHEWAMNIVNPGGTVAEFRAGKCSILKQIAP